MTNKVLHSDWISTSTENGDWLKYRIISLIDALSVDKMVNVS
ncbi:hypothetical protein FM109_16060 [Vibrio casei]|nr:hypothetical protein FM109_16060 [Vibrio casei]